MVKPVLIEPMPVHELLVYTYNVVVGKTKAQDYTKSTPIGPRTTWAEFATDELFFVVGLFVLCHVWEVMGRAIARAGGLKRGKVDSFAASFLELGYYSLSLFCGYRVFKDTDWVWKSGWDKLMYDGRIQMTSPEMLPYAVSPDTKFVYLMEIALSRRLPPTGVAQSQEGLLRDAFSPRRHLYAHDLVLHDWQRSHRDRCLPPAQCL